jgi:archaellin
LQKPVAAGLWHQPRLAPGFAVRWVAAAVAASVLIVVGGNRYYSQKQSAAEAERVKQEVKVALQIASEKLNNVREKVQRLSQREF